MLSDPEKVLDRLRTSTPPLTEEELEPLRAKLEEARSKGVAVDVSDEAVHDLHCFHDMDVVHELCVAIDQEIAVVEAIKAGATPEQAMEEVLGIDAEMQKVVAPTQ